MATDAQVKATIEAAIKKYDMNSTGTLTPAQAEDMGAELFPKVPKKTLKAMIHRFDKDNNEKIDVSELSTFFTSLLSKRERITAEFETLDTDGSGDLDFDELQQTLKDRCGLNEGIFIYMVLDEYDLNKDGKISKTEFINMWHNLFGTA